MILITFLTIRGITTFCVQPEIPALRAASHYFENQQACQKGHMAGAPPTHRGDEPVQRLPSLRVLDRDGAKVIAEPDGGDDAARMAIGYVLLRWRRREGGCENQTYRPCLMVGGGWRVLWRPHRKGPSSLLPGARLPQFLSPFPLEALLSASGWAALPGAHFQPFWLLEN